MKLTYPVNARIPTEKAHGLQIMKMCEAFASSGKFEEVELIVPFRIGGIKKDPFEYYGAKKNFKITKICCFDLFGIKILPRKFCFYLQYLSFAVFAAIFLFFARRSEENLFYTRDWLLLYFFSFWRQPVAEIHDYKSDKPKNWIRRVMARSRKIITNSEGTKKFLQEHYPISDEKIMTAPNGVDLEFFNVKVSKSEARERLRLRQSPIIISYIGRLETLGMEKGVSDLIEAFASLAKSRKDIFLLIIGGPNKLIEKYKEKAALAGLSHEQVAFVGQVEYLLIPFYLKAIDIVVVPFPANKQFSFTASPIKIFEFLAAGKTIIASDLPALKMVLNDDSALFFEPGDVGSLMNKIDALINNREIATSMALRAREESKKFSWTERAKKIMAFISPEYV